MIKSLSTAAVLSVLVLSGSTVFAQALAELRAAAGDAEITAPVVAGPSAVLREPSPVATPTVEVLRTKSSAHNPAFPLTAKQLGEMHAAVSKLDADLGRVRGWSCAMIEGAETAECVITYDLHESICWYGNDIVTVSVPVAKPGSPTIVKKVWQAGPASY